MFPRLTERLGSALDLVVEFSTLGAYRLDVCSAPRPVGARWVVAGPRPGLGGAGDGDAGVLPAGGPVAAVAPARRLPRAPAGERRLSASSACGPQERRGAPAPRGRPGAPVPVGAACLAED
jgi:hypothetical protein